MLEKEYIVLMVKFFKANGEITKTDVNEIYAQIGYKDDKTIFELLKNIAGVIEDFKLKDMLWFWCDYKGIISKNDVQQILAIAN